MHTNSFARPPCGSILGCMLVAALLLLPLPGGRVAPAAAASPAWRDTGLALPEGGTTCWDATQPGLLLVGYPQAGALGPAGSYALDTRSGQATRFSSQVFDRCSEPTGLLFATDVIHHTAVRFSRAAPAGRPIAHAPTHLAADGTATLYALEPTGPIAGLSLAPGDARTLLAVTQTYSGTVGGQLDYAIYFSTDGGATWEPRAAARIPATGFTGVGAGFLSGPLAPANTAVLSIGNGIPGSNAGATIYLSIDGARSFRPVGEWSISSYTRLLQTPDGLLRLRFARGATAYSLDRSGDGGQTWEARALPLTAPAPPSGHLDLVWAPAAPANIFLYNAGPADDAGLLWYSGDSGQHWQALGPRPAYAALYPSPYIPLTVLRVDPATRALTALDLPAAGQGLPARVPALGLPGARYFPETGHNLAGPLRAYWEAQGGLAQFGYPRTEAFREISLTDGRVYTVQYFERNQLEYHPEYAGTRYEVLLGLLGVELTADLRAAGHGAFNRFSDAHYSGARYFPETGHNLRSSFLAYWQAHGGLASHGYPISEEFEEVSPDDGRMYIVQYFQRSRFEWHPENRGTPYEVLLGLLGNRLLALQGRR